MLDSDGFEFSRFMSTNQTAGGSYCKADGMTFYPLIEEDKNEIGVFYGVTVLISKDLFGPGLTPSVITSYRYWKIGKTTVDSTQENLYNARTN